MSLRWVRSSRVGNPAVLTEIREGLGAVNDAIAAYDPIARYMREVARVQAIIDRIATAISAPRVLSENTGLGLRELAGEYLTDGAYFVAHSNYGQLVDRLGVGALLDSTEASLDEEVNEDFAPYPGVRSTVPPRSNVDGLFYNENGFRDIAAAKRRRLIYGALDLATPERYESFESWLVPLIEAFYDTGDPQRPQWSEGDKIGGIIFTVEGTNFLEVEGRIQALTALFQGMSAPPLLPQLNVDDIMSSDVGRFLSEIASQDRPPTDGSNISQMIDLLQQQILVPTFIEDIQQSTFTYRPDFQRLSTADLLPLAGRIFDLLDFAGRLLSPTLPINLSLDRKSVV